MSTDLFDITIIGGGPSGLYAAFYAGLRDAKTKVIDSLQQLGGQLAALYPEKYVYDIPGFTKVLASEFVERQVEQAMRFSPTICLGEKVVKFERRDDGTYALGTEQGNLHLTQTVIIAAGVGAFVPRTLDIPDVKRMEGKGVYYYVRDLEAFRDKRVVVIGGGDTAVDWAQRLVGIAREIRLVNRSDRFRAHEEMVKELMATTCEVCTFQELKALHGKDRVESATIFDNRTGAEYTVDVDAVVLGLGFLANLGPIKEWGLQIMGNSVVVDHMMQTNLPGVYGVGDVVTYEGKLKLIATATGEAAIATNYAKNRIDPSARVSPGHSSERNQ
jgi:ferredoxin/flavodoxin---NADP+ reductase